MLKLNYQLDKNVMNLHRGNNIKKNTNLYGKDEQTNPLQLSAK